MSSELCWKTIRQIKLIEAHIYEDHNHQILKLMLLKLCIHWTKIYINH